MRFGMLIRPAPHSGRAGVRASAQGSGQQQGQPGQFGIFGKTMWLLVFIAVFAHWWRIGLIVVLVTLFFALPLAYALGKRNLNRKPQRDELDQIMAAWDQEARR